MINLHERHELVERLWRITDYKEFEMENVSLIHTVLQRGLNLAGDFVVLGYGSTFYHPELHGYITAVVKRDFSEMRVVGMEIIDEEVR
jgi:hypothetical protein